MRRILVVEDEPAIRDVVADALEMSDYAVETAANGAEALEKLRQHLPDAILLDLMMPVMDGWEFMAAVKRTPQARRVPIAIMSAASRAMDEARELGATAFIPKPFNLDEFLDAVDHLASRDCSTRLN